MSDFKSFRASQDSITLENTDLKGKNILIRVDFNCPVENGTVTNNYRIKETLKTLNFLKDKGARKITLITHFKRPKGKYDPALSLKPVREELEKLWPEKVECPPYDPDFAKYSSLAANSLSPIVLWENIRFWPGEKANDSDFSEALAKGQDLFVNEAFSASHRTHASVVGVTKLLPSYAGFLLAEEVRKIYQLMNERLSPSVAIVGGAKIETKVPVLRALSENYDKIILGGKIAIEYAELYSDKGAEINSETVPREAWTKKIELPTGYLSEEKFDIDENSALNFAKIIQEAKKIIWNGPVGKFEEPEFRKGSTIIAEAIAKNKSALRLIGGGDTVELVEKLKLEDQVGFVSTGGGAMLEYIANKTLPGLEELRY